MPSSARGTSERRSCSRSWACPESVRAACVYELSSNRRRRSRARHLASGPLPRVRRRRDALGALGDRQGAGGHRRAGLARRGRAEARERRRDVLADTGDANWVESQLRSLVGLSAESELGDDRRQSAFAAWRRFLEAMAEQRPLVVVFEDLHWADESLLDFVDELVDWVTDVPLLAVATARPELLERRPGWGGGKLNATTLALPPLSEDQTALLIAQLLERSVLPAESQQALLERAGGNPLYAEQFAELFLERGSGRRARRFPETLQGIIAARLDGLADTEKDLLRDAAVIGKVFWASAVRNGSDTVDDPALARAQGIRAPPEALVRRRRDRVRVCTRPRSRRRLRADRQGRPCGEAPRCRGVDRGPRASGRPRRDACPPLAVGVRARSRGRQWRLRTSRSRLAWRFAKRAIAPPRSTPTPRPRSTTQRHSRSGRTATLSARIFCFVERRSLHLAGDDRRDRSARGSARRAARCR